jgi:competence protein ComEC
VALGWLCGVALQLRQPVILPGPALAGLVVGAAALVVVSWPWRRSHGLAVALALALAAGALGFSSTSVRASARLAQALSPALEGSDLWVSGVVGELPHVGTTGVRFMLEVEDARLDDRAMVVPPRLSLGWYRTGDDDAAQAGPGPDLRAGQRWLLPVRLRAPHGTLNPEGFDLELWFFEQGIGASGTVRDRPATPPRKLAEDTGGHPIERLRQTLRDAIARQVTDVSTAGVLAALVIGDQAAIDGAGWDLFRVTGVAHLMSISGLHVTMFAWLAGAAVGSAWRRWPRWMLACPAPVAALWGGWVAAAGYALLAGWGVPAQRTVWMLAVVALLRGAGLRWPLHAVLLAAAWAAALLDPWALLQPGFWLSYGAVALLVASEPAHAPSASAPAGRAGRLLQAVRAGLRTQAIATVGLAPLTLVFFQQVSLVGFVANAVAIPLVTLLITPLALLGVLLPALWVPAAWLVQGLVAGLAVLAAGPLLAWSAAAAPAWAVACGLLGGALAVLPLPWRLRALALPLALPLGAPPVERPPAGRFELLAADIGQGTAVLVRTREHLIVFDTGPQGSPEANAGSRVLLPLLRARGETRVDLLVLSHRDTDHVGGAAALMAGVRVEALSSSLSDDHPLRAGNLPHRRCDAGQAWVWDGVRFEILHPLAADHASPLRSNALSCVLKVQGTAASALLTGDIEAPQEAALVARAAERLHSDVLVVPHHGSRTSSTPGFIEAVGPRVAVFQAAYRSRFGHPAPAVVARYVARGVAIVRSDRCGAWTLHSDGSVHCEREKARRYWHHRIPVDGSEPP